MAISRKYILTVDGYTCRLSSSLTFYRNDALHLIFSVNEYGVKVKNGVTTRTTMPIHPLSAVLLVETPENHDYIESTKVEGDEIHFHLDARYTSYIGVSRMQIVLTDENCCQVTLPEFNFEVRNNIYDAVLKSDELFLSDENNSEIVTENDEKIKVGRAVGDPYKEIRELTETDSIIGTEDMILQNSDGETRRVKSSTICSSIIEEVSNPFTIRIYSDITVAELGSTINNLGLTWDYNKEIVSQFLDDVSYNISVREESYTNIKENRTFTITAKSIMGVELTAKHTVSFANGIYYGKSSTKTVDNNLFNSLNKQLSDNKSRTITVNAGKDEHIFYCYPKRLGDVTFTVNGFDGGFNKVATYTFKNESGYTEDYVVYMSTNANLGNTTITIK